MVRGTDNNSGESATPGEADLRGEDLANHSLAEPEVYMIAPDETEAEELTESSENVEAAGDELEIDDPEQLADSEESARLAKSTEPVTLAEQVRSSRPVRKSIEVAKKGTATPSRRKAPTGTAEKGTTPPEFVNQSVEELKKVVWPTGQQVRQYFWVVLVFILFIMAYVVSLDASFGALLLKLFG